MSSFSADMELLKTTDVQLTSFWLGCLVYAYHIVTNYKREVSCTCLLCESLQGIISQVLGVIRTLHTLSGVVERVDNLVVARASRMWRGMFRMGEMVNVE